MALKLKGSTSGFVGLDAPAVAGNNTLILPENSGSAFQIFANDITAGVTTFTQVTVSRNGDLTVPGTISIGGTLTYEDVTSVDSVGIVTARGLSIFGNTTGLNAGISTFTGDVNITNNLPQIYLTDSNSSNARARINANGGNLLLGADNDNAAADSIIYFEIDGSEKLRITSDGKVGIATDSASKKLDIATDASSDGIRIRSKGATYNDITISSNRTGANQHLGRVVAHWNDTAVAYMAFNTGADTSNKDDGEIFFATSDGSGTTRKVTIKSNGNLLMGTNTAAISGGIGMLIANSAGARIKLCDSDLGVTASDGFELIASDNGTAYLWNRENMPLLFGTNNAERMQITAGGAVLVAGTSAYSDGTFGEAKLQFNTKTGNHIGACSVADTTNSVTHVLFKNPNGAIASVGTHNSDLVVFTGNTERFRIKSDGRIGFNNDLSSAYDSTYNQVVMGDGSGNNGVVFHASTTGGTYLGFKDTGDGTVQGILSYTHSDDAMGFRTNGTEKMRIMSTGSVRIGTSNVYTLTASSGGDDFVVGDANSGVNRGMTIYNHTGSDGRICFAQGGLIEAGMIKYSHGSDVLQFFVEANEIVRLAIPSAQGTAAMQLRKPNAASNVQSHMIHLQVGGHDRGALIAGSSFGASALVGATSDYRVKTNIRDYTDGWNNIKAIPVKIFDINLEGEEATDVKGWIAHEVQAVIPEAVCGAKDAKKEDGSDDLQSLGYNVFMPDVVSALQTAMAKIETLEAEVAALKGG